MKVRITFEIEDTDRIMLGTRATGEIKPATREEIEGILSDFVEVALDELRGPWNQKRDELVSNVYKNIGKAKPD